MEKDDELLDLVNREDQVIGTINRKDYKQLLAEHLGYIRAVDLFIVNEKGQIFVPIRTADKTIAPNGYDYSAGGHVGAGEGYVDTIIREAEEEIYLQIDAGRLEFLAKFIDDELKYIREVYVFRANDTPRLNPSDAVSAQWLSPDEVIKKIDAGHPAKVSMKLTVQRLKEYLHG